MSRPVREPRRPHRCRHGRDPDERKTQISVEYDEHDVLARVRGGDRDAYAELVRRHAPVALRAASLLGAGPDAEDIVQEAFVKAYAHLGSFRENAAFRPWLLRIVANETSNLRRGVGRRAARERSAWERTQPLLAAAQVDEPAAAALSVERRTELVCGLATLSEPHRRVITCRYLLDLDEGETAAVLGWSRGTVKSRLHRGLKLLAEQLTGPDTATDPEIRTSEARHGA